MSLKIDRLQLEIIINNDQARKQLRHLEEEFISLKKEQKKFTSDSAEWKQMEAKIKSNRQQWDTVIQSIGTANMTLKELMNRSRELALMKQHLRPGTDAYKQLDTELKSVNNRMLELKGKSKGAGDSISNLDKSKTAIIGVVAALAGAAMSVKKFFDAYREQERAVQKVEQAIKSTSNAAGLSLRTLTDEASRLQRNTLFGDEDILNKSTAQLLTFTNITGKTFIEAQRAAMDLSTVLDGDLQNASITLGKALNEPVIGLKTLRRVGVSFTEDQIKTIKSLADTNRLSEAQALILAEVSRQYGGQAEAAAKGAGQWQQVGNVIGEVSETIGSKLAKGLSTAATWIKRAASEFNWWIAEKPSDELEQERTKVNGLASALMDAKLPMEVRNKMYNELKKIAPTVLNGITAEKIEVGKLTQNLALYNDQMVKRIILQRREDDLSHAREKTADVFEDLYAAEEKVMQDANKIFGQIAAGGDKALKQQAISLKAQLMNGKVNTEEYAKSLFKLKNIVETGVTYTNSMGISSEAEFQEIKNLNELTRNRNLYNSLLGKTTDMQKESSDLAKEFGITLNQDVNVDLNKKATPATESEEEQKKARKTAEDLYKQKREIINNAIDSEIALMEEGYQKELVTLYNSFERQREEIKHELDTNSKLTVDQRKLLNNQLNNLDILQEQQYNKLNEDRNIKALQSEKELLDLRISTVSEGSKEELDLKKQLLQNQADTEIAQLTESEREKGEKEILIRKKYDKKIADEDLKFSEKFLDDKLKTDMIALVDSEGKKLEELKRKRATGEISQKEYNRQLLEIQNKFKQDSLQIALDKAQRELDIIKAAGGDTIDAEKALADARLNIEEGKNAKETGKGSGWKDWSTNDKLKAASDAAQQIADATFQIGRDANQRELDLKLSSLGKEREAALANKNLTEAQKDAINKKFDAKERAIKKAAWEKQHKADIAQAWVNLALMVGKAAINEWPVPAIPMMAAAALEGGIQVAAVSKQKVPEFSKGRYNVTGESGKQYTADFTGPARTALYTKPALVAETGAEIIIDPATTKNLQMNYPEVINAINFARVRQFATGRYTEPSSSMPPSPSGRRAGDESAQLQQMINFTTAVDKFTNTVEKLQADGVKGDWSLFDLEKVQTQKSTIEASTTM